MNPDPAQQNNTLKTAHVLSSHSYQITIKELTIMLPLHGQNTVAPRSLKVSGQAILQKLTRKNVFVKKADMKFCRIPQKKLTSKYKTTY